MFGAGIDENRQRHPHAVSPFDWWFVSSATLFPGCAWQEGFAPFCEKVLNEDDIYTEISHADLIGFTP